MKNMKNKIIAELAQGFEGDLVKAKLLVNAAACSGADIAKLQLVYADELATPDYLHYKLFKSLEMPDNSWKELMDYSKELNIELNFDVFGTKSLNLCQELGIKGIKLHGTDMTNIGLLNEVSESNIKNIYLGAGGSNLTEIELAISILKNKNIILLLGFQSYPTPNNDNQISRVNYLKAYLIAAISVITLITLYSKSILKTLKFPLFIGISLSLLYSFIFIIIQLENYALLVGSVGLFSILAAVMYFSRKIDWQND